MLPISFSFTSYTFIFLLLTIPPYVASLLFAFKYVHARKREFYIFFCLTFAGNVLLFFSSNLFTLFVVYEIVSLVSFPLILQERIKSSYRAAKLYFFFSLLSGVLVLAGVMFAQLAYNPILGATLMGVGFLIKAGGYPFHIWLPEAHPVAPSPASAILSGCIIKIGFFGLLQTVLLVQLPSIYGIILLVIAAITMFYGVLQALTQSNMKRMLAYHSVSQMGYILMGLALFIAFQQQDALMGSILHAVNHAWFKSALFIAAGVMVVYFSTLDMYSIRGLLKKKWLVAILFLVAVMGISGVPFTNGFVSKNALHETLVEHCSIAFIFMEAIFLLTAVGTFASNFKMFYLTSFRSMQKKYQLRFDWREIIPLGILAILILVFGCFPLLYETFLPKEATSVHLLESFQIGHHAFSHSAISFLWILVAGVVLIAVGIKKGWFHIVIPYEWTPLCWWFVVYGQWNHFLSKYLMKLETLIFTLNNRIITFFVSPWFVSCQRIDKYWPGFAPDRCKCITNECNGLDCVIDRAGNKLIPGKRTISDWIEKKTDVIERNIDKMWVFIKKELLVLVTKTDKEDQKNAYVYSFVVTKWGKIIIGIAAIVSLLVFVMFLVMYA